MSAIETRRAAADLGRLRNCAILGSVRQVELADPGEGEPRAPPDSSNSISSGVGGMPKPSGGDAHCPPGTTDTDFLGWNKNGAPSGGCYPPERPRPPGCVYPPVMESVCALDDHLGSPCAR